MQVQIWTNENNGGPIDTYDYDLIEILGEVYLNRSNSTSWTTPGERVATLVDDGNKINIKINNKKIVLNYEEQVQLLALLMYNYKDSIELRKSEILKSI